jgi:hypothetical protein
MTRRRLNVSDSNAKTSFQSFFHSMAIQNDSIQRRASSLSFSNVMPHSYFLVSLWMFSVIRILYFAFLSRPCCIQSSHFKTMSSVLNLPEISCCHSQDFLLVLCSTYIPLSKELNARISQILTTRTPHPTDRYLPASSGSPHYSTPSPSARLEPKLSISSPPPLILYSY